MSFILESIKQAERERKLSQQQAPEISIEYTGTHIDDIENSKMRWALFLIGLIITAILVWSAAYYLTNQDKQYTKQFSANTVNSDTSKGDKPNAQIQVEAIPLVQDDIAQKSFSMVPVKKLHTSDLKSVKLITEEEEAPISNVVSDPLQTKQPIKKVVSQKNKSVSYVDKEADSESVIEKQFQVAATKLESASSKQELVKIYADLAALENVEAIVDEREPFLTKIEEKQVQIKTANYTAPEEHVSATKKEENVSLSQVSHYKSQHEKAVNSGVPSFGELPYEIQERIPDFNVSVHMFHADPQQRRIRINGQMYTEGKSLQQDLALVEITRFGAVFDYQGQLFRFSVR